MKTFIRTFPLLLALLLSACSDGTGPAAEPWLGTYTLHEVNGQALPASLEAGILTIVATSGSLELHASGRWSETLMADFYFAYDPDPTSERLDDGGTFSVNGATLRLVSDGGQVYAGTVKDGALSYSVPDEGFGAVTLQFRR